MTILDGMLRGDSSATELCGSTADTPTRQRIVVFVLNTWPRELYLALSDQDYVDLVSRFTPDVDVVMSGTARRVEGRRAVL